MQPRIRWPIPWSATLISWGLAAASWSNASAQDGSPTSPDRAAPEPTTPLHPTSTTPITAEQLAERLKVMEELNRKLVDQLERSNRENQEQMKRLLEKVKDLSDRVEGRKDGALKKAQDTSAPPPTPADDRSPTPDPTVPRDPTFPVGPATASPDTPVPDYTEGQFFPYSPAPGYSMSDARERKRLPLGGTFGPGFQFQTQDEEVRLQIHYESQIEARVWAQSKQVPANSGFYLPRQRIFFNGNITKPIEYEFSINRGFGALNILNAYVNLHFDDRFELRLGRFFTPLDYDQYAISNYWLPTPERSLFTTNVGLSRAFGLMAWGYLLDKRVDYASGIFNGSRNSFEPLANGVDFVTYLNTRPLQESETLPFLRFLNLGTSFAYGYQDQSAVPSSFRIAGGSPNADVPGPGTVPFLILNRDVIERGDRLLGSVHSAFFHKSLSLIGEWQYGYGNYASPAHTASTQVPFSGFYVSGGYFLTGEQVERRSRVTPLRPFLPINKGDRRGPGAWEVTGRVSELGLGKQVFASGFADPNLWADRATTTELGLNWYWNDYIKLSMFWLHGDFSSPVQYRPGAFQKSSDLFWMRFQLYF